MLIHSKFRVSKLLALCVTMCYFGNISVILRFKVYSYFLATCHTLVQSLKIGFKVLNYCPCKIGFFFQGINVKAFKRLAPLFKKTILSPSKWVKNHGFPFDVMFHWSIGCHDFVFLIAYLFNFLFINTSFFTNVGTYLCRLLIFLV